MINIQRIKQSAFASVSLITLGILIVILASLFYYLTYNEVMSANESRDITATLTAQSFVDKVDRNFYERFGDVQAFAYNRLAVATAEKDSVVTGMQEFINTMTAYYVLYDLMMICGKDGKVLAVNSMDKNGQALRTSKFLTRNMSNEEWFKVCTSSEGPAGGAWYSDFTKNKEIGEIYGTDGQGMAYAAPIKNAEGVVVGVWYNYASWKEVTDGIRDEAEKDLARDHHGSLAIMTKKTGEIISAGDQSLVGKVLKIDSTEVESEGISDAMAKMEYGIGRSKGAYTFAGKNWISVVFIPGETVSWSVFFSKKNLAAVSVCIVVVLLVLAYVLRFFRKNIISRINYIGDLQKRLSEGELVQLSGTAVKQDEFGSMMISLTTLASGLHQKAVFSDEISKGNLSAELENLSEKDVLGKSLINMRNQLRAAQESDAQRNWTAEGLAQIGSLLRSYNSVQELYTSAIKFVVNYLKANQGGLFLIDGEDDDLKIKLVSCYAYDKRKFLEKEMDFGNGLVGQCILEKGTLYLTDVPDNYVRITSGLGGANPNALIIVPLKSNEQVYGALELASFERFKPHEISFIEKIAESIASTVGTARGSERTKELVEQLQQQTEEMKSQEEEMRQNMEELSATQEEMLRKEKEYVSRIRELEQI